LQNSLKKLVDNSKKSGDVKTEREMKSLQLEEEIAKEQVTFANEEIERLERIVELKNCSSSSKQKKYLKNLMQTWHPSKLK